MKTRRTLSLALATLALGSLAIGSAAATDPPPAPDSAAKKSEEPPPLDPEEAQIQRDQAPLVEAANEIRRVNTESSAKGFAGIRVDVYAKTVSLYWKGQPPKEITDRVDKLQQTAKIEVHPDAPYSHDELDRERDAIFASQKTRNIEQRYRVHTAGILSDGTGLDLTVQEDNEQERGRYRQNPKVKVVRAAPPPTGLTRQADTPPYWGGAHIRIGTRSCTTGFEVTSTSVPNRVLMLTAGHCFNNPAIGTEVFDGNGTRRVGWVKGIIRDRETMLIDLDQGTQKDGRVYDGAWNATSNYSKPVVAWEPNNMGERVCFMGSFSGSRCGITITNDDTKYEVPGLTVPYMVEATGDDGRAISGQGDSGGSVVRLTGTNNSQFIARGTISFGNNSWIRACLGNTVYNGQARICHNKVLYMPISVQLNNWDATPVYD